MNWKQIEQLAGLLDEQAVSEITVSRNGARVTVKKQHAPASAASPSASPMPVTPGIIAMPAPEPDETILITAPMVGLFHHAKTPVRYASLVSAEQVVGNIEAMKLMNEVVAEKGGRVVEVLIEDGGPVEYGQPLFRLAP